MSERSLAGKRVVVVGASAGIGRAFAVRAGKEGANLVVAARRQQSLAEVVEEVGGGVPVVIDIRRTTDIARVAEAASAALGEIDLLFIAAGYAPLKKIEETTEADLLEVLQTNVIGVHETIRACLPLLTPSAIVAALSSDSIRCPHNGLGAYSTSKAAMERSLVSWRLEKPGYRFSCVEVGGTVPTDFTSAFDPKLLGTVSGEWIARGLVPANLMAPEDVADTLAGIFASAIDHPDIALNHIVVKSPAAPMQL